MRACQPVGKRCHGHSPSTHAIQRAYRRERRCHGSRDGDGIPQKDDDCWAILREFTRAEFKGTASTTYLQSKESREVLRNALLDAIQSRNDSINWDPASSPILLGILSSDVRLAMRSLRDYTAALSVEFVQPESTTPLPQIQGSVYIRYKSSISNRWGSSGSSSSGKAAAAAERRSQEHARENHQHHCKKNSRKSHQGQRIAQCTISSYSGHDRGVLIQLGTLQVGHLPLGLLDEGMANPPAPIS